MQLLTITDAALIPDELCDLAVTIPWSTWKMLCGSAEPALKLIESAAPLMKLGSPMPSNERIRAALQQPCPSCGGIGIVSGSPRLGRVICSECHGTKTASVPGCRLEPRGETVIVK